MTGADTRRSRTVKALEAQLHALANAVSTLVMEVHHLQAEHIALAARVSEWRPPVTRDVEEPRP